MDIYIVILENLAVWIDYTQFSFLISLNHEKNYFYLKNYNTIYNIHYIITEHNNVNLFYWLAILINFIMLPIIFYVLINILFGT